MTDLPEILSDLRRAALIIEESEFKINELLQDNSKLTTKLEAAEKKIDKARAALISARFSSDAMYAFAKQEEALKTLQRSEGDD